MTQSELCYSLVRFVLEVRHLNGDEYPPDAIYHATLNVQKYLAENQGHIDIFHDKEYEEFIDTLNEIARSSSKRNMD